MRVATLSVLIAGAALAGCGGGSSPRQTGSSAASLCARVPIAAVEHLVATADPKPPPKLRRSARGTQLLVQCGFGAPGVKVGVSLDRANNNRQRFDNRVTEMSQFSTYRPSTRPRPVPGVGDAAAGDEGAQWIPAPDQLLAYRPGQYLIVDFTAGGATDAANRRGAAAVARLAFARLPRGHGINRRGAPTPTG
jgi:hypothetical protein